MKARYLFPKDYMADPSANVFNGRLYVYPSHDWDSGESFDDDGGHFQMKDYHVLSMDDVMEGEVTDHGVILDVKDVPWAEKQMWDNDVVEKDGKYYLIFSAKDYNGVFHLGVAVADKPEGPFIPNADPIRKSYSINLACSRMMMRQDLLLLRWYLGAVSFSGMKDNKATEG